MIEIFTWYIFNVWMYVITALSYSETVLNIFMPKTCFEIWAWYDAKTITYPFLTKNLYNKQTPSYVRDLSLLGVDNYV